MLHAVAATLVLLAVCVPATFAAEGGQVYKERCAKCHGDTGKADTPVAKTLKTPPLAGDAKVAGMADADLVKAITANPKHAAFMKTVTAADVTAVAAYVKQLAAGQ
jgi:mono/diheme cytochrome c family protein